MRLHSEETLQVMHRGLISGYVPVQLVFAEDSQNQQSDLSTLLVTGVVLFLAKLSKGLAGPGSPRRTVETCW